MTDPFDTPTDRWGQIFYGSTMNRPAHTRQEWAQIADAIRAADQIRAGGPGVRRDDAWCSVAVETYRRLNADSAYGHMLPEYTPRWHADADLIRAWLTTPVNVVDDQPATMLDAYGWPMFDPARTPEPGDVSLLVDVAQAEGVVGAPRHKVSLLSWVENGVFRDDAFLVLAWRPDGPPRTSSAIDMHALLPAAGSAADRIIGLFDGAASVANTLMSATDADESRPEQTQAAAPGTAGPDTSPNHPRGRPFRVLDAGNAAGPATSAPTLRAVPADQHPQRRPRT
jgi:hypothetical protein